MNRVTSLERHGLAIVASEIAAAAQLACLLEATAAKPGNVSPGIGFVDLSCEDFLASAAAIGGPLSGAGDRPLGTTVRLAIDATRRWCSSNTNLGMVLLLAPIARAAFAIALPGKVRLKPDTTEAAEVRLKPDTTDAEVRLKPDTTDPEVRLKPDTTDPEARVEADGINHIPVVSGFSRTDDAATSGFASALREELRHVLATTTVDDAREVYAAIRHAAPGGLGRVEAQDVAREPDVTLLEAMRLAADRDGIAREYATTFARTFEVGAPALIRARRDGLAWNQAIVEAFLVLLAAAPDTHIARRGGRARAEEVSRVARTVLDAGGVRSDAGRTAIERMDAALRDPQHIANPGTTADLTAASIFVVLLTAGCWRIQQEQRRTKS
jgi:triphosphoribosyl-dephospho-CoA synthetase